MSSPRARTHALQAVSVNSQLLFTPPSSVRVLVSGALPTQDEMLATLLSTVAMRHGARSLPRARPMMTRAAYEEIASYRQITWPAEWPFADSRYFARPSTLYTRHIHIHACMYRHTPHVYTAYYMHICILDVHICM